jgi:hypothetical protein
MASFWINKASVESLLFSIQLITNSSTPGIISQHNPIHLATQKFTKIYATCLRNSLTGIFLLLFSRTQAQLYKTTQNIAKRRYLYTSRYECDEEIPFQASLSAMSPSTSTTQSTRCKSTTRSSNTNSSQKSGDFFSSDGSKPDSRFSSKFGPNSSLKGDNVKPKKTEFQTNYSISNDINETLSHGSIYSEESTNQVKLASPDEYQVRSSDHDNKHQNEKSGPVSNISSNLSQHSSKSSHRKILFFPQTPQIKVHSPEAYKTHTVTQSQSSNIQFDNISPDLSPDVKRNHDQTNSTRIYSELPFVQFQLPPIRSLDESPGNQTPPQTNLSTKSVFFNDELTTTMTNVDEYSIGSLSDDSLGRKSGVGYSKSIRGVRWNNDTKYLGENNERNQGSNINQNVENSFLGQKDDSELIQKTTVKKNRIKSRGSSLASFPHIDHNRDELVNNGGTHNGMVFEDDKNPFFNSGVGTLSNHDGISRRKSYTHGKECVVFSYCDYADAGENNGLQSGEENNDDVPYHIEPLEGLLCSDSKSNGQTIASNISHPQTNHNGAPTKKEAKKINFSSRLSQFETSTLTSGRPNDLNGPVGISFLELDSDDSDNCHVLNTSKDDIKKDCKAPNAPNAPNAPINQHEQTEAITSKFETDMLTKYNTKANFRSTYGGSNTPKHQPRQHNLINDLVSEIPAHFLDNRSHSPSSPGSMTSTSFHSTSQRSDGRQLSYTPSTTAGQVKKATKTNKQMLAFGQDDGGKQRHGFGAQISTEELTNNNQRREKRPKRGLRLHFPDDGHGGPLEQFPNSDDDNDLHSRRLLFSGGPMRINTHVNRPDGDFGTGNHFQNFDNFEHFHPRQSSSSSSSSPLPPSLSRSQNYSNSLSDGSSDGADFGLRGHPTNLRPKAKRSKSSKSAWRFQTNEINIDNFFPNHAPMLEISHVRDNNNNNPNKPDTIQFSPPENLQNQSSLPKPGSSNDNLFSLFQTISEAQFNDYRELSSNYDDSDYFPENLTQSSQSDEGNNLRSSANLPENPPNIWKHSNDDYHSERGHDGEYDGEYDGRNSENAPMTGFNLQNPPHSVHKTDKPISYSSTQLENLTNPERSPSHGLTAGDPTQKRSIGFKGDDFMLYPSLNYNEALSTHSDNSPSVVSDDISALTYNSTLHSSSSHHSVGVSIVQGYISFSKVHRFYSPHHYTNNTPSTRTSSLSLLGSDELRDNIHPESSLKQNGQIKPPLRATVSPLSPSSPSSSSSYLGNSPYCFSSRARSKTATVSGMHESELRGNISSPPSVDDFKLFEESDSDPQNGPNGKMGCGNVQNVQKQLANKIDFKSPASLPSPQITPIVSISPLVPLSSLTSSNDGLQEQQLKLNNSESTGDQNYPQPLLLQNRLNLTTSTQKNIRHHYSKQYKLTLPDVILSLCELRQRLVDITTCLELILWYYPSLLSPFDQYYFNNCLKRHLYPTYLHYICNNPDIVQTDVIVSLFELLFPTFVYLNADFSQDVDSIEYSHSLAAKMAPAMTTTQPGPRRDDITAQPPFPLPYLTSLRAENQSYRDKKPFSTQYHTSFDTLFHFQDELGCTIIHYLCMKQFGIGLSSARTVDTHYSSQCLDTILERYVDIILCEGQNKLKINEAHPKEGLFPFHCGEDGSM